MPSQSSILISSHSTVALLRCSSLRGSVLTFLFSNYSPELKRKAHSAAKRTARPVQCAAHAGQSDTNRRGVLHKSLAEECPDLAWQWVQEGNGDLTPELVLAASGFKALWRCDRGCEHCGLPHEWKARVVYRSQQGRGCPFCAKQRCCKCQSLAAKHPDLMKEWDLEGNKGIDPYSLSCRSQRRVSWVCPEHAQWDTTPDNQTAYGSGCPKCAEERQTGVPRPKRKLVKDELPRMYAELHPTKNGKLDTENLTCGSHKRVWWLCQSEEGRPEGCQHEHAWEARIKDRCSRRSTGCPFCSESHFCPCNSLAGRCPTLMDCWDFAGNAIPLTEPLDPAQLGLYSKKKAWWRHDCGDGQVHHWCATIQSVVKTFTADSRVPCPGCAPAIRSAKFAKQRKRFIKRK